MAGWDLKGRYLLDVALDELRRGDLLGRQTLLQLQPDRLAPLRPADTQDTHRQTHTHTHLQTTGHSRHHPILPTPASVVCAEALCLRVAALREEEHRGKKQQHKKKKANTSETTIHMKEKNTTERTNTEPWRPCKFLRRPPS